MQGWRDCCKGKGLSGSGLGEHRVPLAMTTWTKVRLLARVSSFESSGRESRELTLFERQVDECSEAAILALVDESLATAESWRSGVQGSKTSVAEVQLSIQIFSEDESSRPALQLSAEQVRRLAAANASLDFDPYFY